MTLVLLRRAEHVLFAALLLTGTVRAVRNAGHPAAALIAAVAVAAWYLLGIALARRSGGKVTAVIWLLVLTGGWMLLVVLSVDFAWVAFALFFLYMQVLPPRAGPLAVVVLTAVTVAAFGFHRQQLDPAAILGPVIGAGVAVVLTIVYRQLREEAELRARLLADLTAAQDELSAVQRRAGTLAERERLAGEIHDTVAQSLSSIILLLRSADAGWRQAPPQSRHQLTTAIDASRTALEDTRRLIRALGPTQLAGTSLTEALRRLTAGSRELGVNAHFTRDGEPYPLPTPVEVALLRSGQEALANVRNHAEADRVEVTLTFLPDRVSLDVVDDGRGFDPDSKSKSDTAGTGMGLASMRRRLAEVGGVLVVESAPGYGAAVSATIPMEGRA